jgi:hypothetical protein
MPKPAFQDSFRVAFTRPAQSDDTDVVFVHTSPRRKIEKPAPCKLGVPGARGDDGASPSRLALESKHRQISLDNGLMATALETEVRRFTIAEYYKLAEAGVLASSERVELLDGRIIRKAPIGPRHATIVDKHPWSDRTPSLSGCSCRSIRSFLVSKWRAQENV